MNKKLLSFHAEQAIKDKYLERLRAHYKADEIIKGKYWEDGKGCAVGCTVHSSSHDAYETELGITWRLALLEDSLFEKLPNELAKEFPIQFLEAMPVGVDTNIIFKKFIIWNLSDKKDGLIYHIKDEKQIELLSVISDTYKKSFDIEIPQSEWLKLADQANRLYRSASASAYAYAYAYAYASAYAYAYASAYAYAYASASASAYAYAYASASKEWDQKFAERILLMRNKLMELIYEQQ